MSSPQSALRAAQPATPVSFAVPADACDCHTHVFGDPARFPYFAGRVYTPPPALPEEMAAFHRALEVRRVVIVTPSVYGTDNSATLFGMKVRGSDARGIAVIDEATPQRDLDAMAAAGFCGLRLNLATDGHNDPALARRRFEAKLPRAIGRNWHIQIFTNLAVIARIKDLILSSPVRVVLDHFGGARAALGPTQAGFADLLDLLRSGKAYVKISGAYRASTEGPDYADAAPLAKALIATNPERIVWGTDWPHTNSTTPPDRKVTDVNPLFQIDDGLLMNQLPIWAPDPAVRKAILTDNPARLYRF
jgi:predicted TIM-barrel fold metal-dependent hydrolase